MDLRSAGFFVVVTLLVTSVPSSGIPLKLQGTSPGAFVGEGINALAVALLQDSQQTPAANVAFSPLGHAAVLAALAEGAAGTTQGELLAALRLPRDAPLGRAAYRAVLSRLQLDTPNKRTLIAVPVGHNSLPPQTPNTTAYLAPSTEQPLSTAKATAELRLLGGGAEEKKKVNKPEFRSWFYVYKTAVQVEKNYADLLSENYLMEVHDIDAPESELPSELADKRKPGVQQGSSAGDEELPEIPFEKPATTVKPTQPEPEVVPTTLPVQELMQNQDTKSEAPTEQEAAAGIASGEPTVEEVPAQETHQAVNSIEEQIGTDAQTVSPMDVLVPATELLPPLEDMMPLAVQPDKQALPEQQTEPDNQVSAQKDTLKSELPRPEEKPVAEEHAQQENVPSVENKPEDDLKLEQPTIGEQQTVAEPQESPKESAPSELTLPSLPEEQTPSAALPEKTATLEIEKTNETPPQENSQVQTEEIKDVQEDGPKEETEKSEGMEAETSEALLASSEESTTNLKESSAPSDPKLAEPSKDVESREAISSRAPASPITAFNALYFRGAWATPFDSRQSTAFNVSPNTSVTVNMLSTVGLFRVGDIPELSATAIELPYNGAPNRYSLLVLLPQESDGALNELTSTLSTRTLRSLGRYMTERLVHVQIPEFEIGYVSYPQTAYKKLGIKAALDANSAEFPGISRSQRLFLQPDALAQLVRFRVDATSSSTNFLSTSSLGSNSGPILEPPAPASPSEAAEPGAATRSGALQFRADRPFIFVLRDNVDKLTLVAGRIADPSSRPVPPLLP